MALSPACALVEKHVLVRLENHSSGRVSIARPSLPGVQVCVGLLYITRYLRVDAEIHWGVFAGSSGLGGFGGHASSRANSSHSSLLSLKSFRPMRRVSRSTYGRGS